MLNHFRRPVFLLALVAFAGPAQAATVTYSDSFSSGLNPAYWSVTHSTTGLFSVDTSQGDLRLSTLSLPSSYPQEVRVNFNLDHFHSEAIIGDFSFQIYFTEISRGPFDLWATFSDGTYFTTTFEFMGSRRLLSVWSNDERVDSIRVSESVSFGTFKISRTGSTLSGLFDSVITDTLQYDDYPLYSQENTATLTGVSLVLRARDDGYSPAVSLDNFFISVPPIPEPTSTTLLLGAGALTLALTRRQRHRAHPAPR